MEQTKKRSKEEIIAERLENTARRTEALEQEGYHSENYARRRSRQSTTCSFALSSGCRA